MEIFKPVKNEKINTSIRLDETLLEKIDTIATNTGISRNELIVQCLEFAIKHYETDKN